MPGRNHLLPSITACFLISFFSLIFYQPAMAGQLEFSLSSPQPAIIGKTGEQRINMKGFHHIDQPGAPAVPAKVFWFSLPANVIPESLSLAEEIIARETIPQKITLSPVAPYLSQGSGSVFYGKDKKIVNNRDADIYGSNQWFPEKAVEKGQLSSSRDRKIGSLHYFPLRYNPFTGQAEWIKEVRIILSYNQKSESKKMQQAPEKVLSTTLALPLLNSAEAESWYDSGTSSSSELDAASGNGFAVITTDLLKESLYEDGLGSPDPASILYQFAEHKTALGFTVYIVTQNEAHQHGSSTMEAGYGSDTGQQRAVNIRSWLISNHIAAAKNLRYALLIGNPDPDHPDETDSYGDLPMMMCFPELDSGTASGGSTLEAPTDYFFAELSGNWDLDGDNRYCEYSGDRGTGGVEFLPEIYVGRIPFSDEAAITPVLQKVMDYENVSYSEADNSNLLWRKKALLPMSILNFGEGWFSCDGDGMQMSDDAYLGRSAEIHALNPAGFDTWLLTEKEGDPDGLWLSTSDIDGDAPLSKDSLDPESTTKYLDDHWNAANPYGIVFWSLHGSTSALWRKLHKTANPLIYCPSFSTYFGTSSTSQLSNATPAFTISDSCNIGRPETAGNLGATLLESGALVSLAASREGWYYVGDFAEDDDGYLPQTITYADNRATAFYYAQQLSQDMPAGDALFYAKQSKTDSEVSWVNNFGMNIYGDPSVKLLPPAFTKTDTDGDGLPDDEERYIYQSNPALADSDADGLDDGEELIFLKGYWTVDVDGDGLNIFNDPDTDNDGLSDYAEVMTINTNPRKDDTDDDGISDFDEINQDGDPSSYTPAVDFDPNDADSDDDGVNDGDEVAIGDNPLDPWDNKPVADAGSEQWVSAAPGGLTLITLDGTGSSHPKGDPLYFAWSVTTSMSEWAGGVQPSYGTASDGADQPDLHASVGGDYIISLKVRKDPAEDWVWSELSTVSVHVQHTISDVQPQGVTWGDTLTISGLGFDVDLSDNTVTIDGVPATVTSAAYDELQVTVPDGCGAGDVVVTVNDKQSNSFPSGISMPAGSFSPAPAGSLPELDDCSRAVAMGDVDGDNDIDIVVANMGGETADNMDYPDPACQSMNPQNRLYINDGNGSFVDMTFGPDTLASTADDYLPVDTDQSIDVELVDIDNDNDLDMVIANFGAFRAWWQNVGIEDRLECVMAGGQNKIYINDGSGHFSDETLSRLPALADNSVQVAVGHINDDSLPDLIFANDQDCIFQSGDWPVYEDECCYSCGECSAPWFSCDDCPDCSLCTNCEFYWEYGYCEQPGYENHPCCNGDCWECEGETSCVVCCDGTCNSCPDCCNDCADCPDNPGCNDYYHPLRSKDRFYLNAGSGIFVDATDISVSTDQYGRSHNGGGTRAIALGDMDQDGDLDLVRCGYNYSYLRTWLYENVDGLFTLVEPYLSGEYSVVSLLLADFDSDTNRMLDIFGPQDYDYPLYFTQTDTGFVDHSQYGDDWLPTELVWTYSRNDYKYWTTGISRDVDLDGDEDILIGRNTSSQNFLLTNDDANPGQLHYTAGMLPASTENSYGMELADVNGDGAPDLFNANVGQNSLLLNNTQVPRLCSFDSEPDGDVDGVDLAALTDQGVNESEIEEFAAMFGITDCSVQ
ncbi:MAG: VCBS repeat-containing protein [Desulfobulbaceae bacterium]|nr:VCBS repeat-containing protein [Desulfobulbaceae bacterium]